MSWARLALAWGLLAFTCPAGAQDVAVRMPACTPAWWDEAALRDALGVELRGASVVIELAVDGACDESTTLVARLLDDTSTSSRRIELADVAPSARARALAMALASWLAEPREVPARVTPQTPLAPRARLELGDPLASDPEPAPSLDRAEPSLALTLAGVAAIAPASASFWGGPHAGVIARVAPPLDLRASVEALFTAQGDPLGEVRGTWVHGALGAGLEAPLAPFRLGASAALGLGWAQLDGDTSAPDVIARRSDDLIVSVDLGVRAALELAREIAIVLGIDARLVALGLEARSPSGAVITIRDAVLAAHLGIELRP